MDATAPRSRSSTAASRRWFPICLGLHRWSSLIATPFFLVLCVTGLVLVFHDEVDDALGQRPPAVEMSQRPVSIGRLVEAAEANAPGMVPWSAGLDKDQPDRAFVRLVPHGATDANAGRTFLMNRVTGEPMTAMQPDQTFTGVLLKLHSQWFLDVPGQLFGAAIALLVLVSLVTGVVVHAPFVRRMVFGAIRRGRGARIVQLDLHNVIGIVVLGWLTLVTVSGILLGVDVILVPVWRATELQEMARDDHRPPVLAPVDRVIASAEAARPDREFRFVYFPGTDFSSAGHFTVGMYGRERYDEQLFDVVIVDGATAKVSAARALPWYLKAVLVSVPLHYGNYGGLVLKIFWAASTAGAMFITANGAWLWWQRRRRHSSGQRA